MASLNKVQLIGNLGREPEGRSMPSGEQVVNLAIATTDKWKDKSTGEQKEATEWHRVAIFGKLADIAAQYLKKGSQVYLEGKLRTRKYTDKEGVERYATEIIADVLQMLGSPDRNETSRPAAKPAAPARPASRPAAKPASNFADMDDSDIPF